MCHLAATIARPDHAPPEREIRCKPPPPLEPPRLNSGLPVTGKTTNKLRVENRHHRRAKQGLHNPGSRWTQHTGNFVVPKKLKKQPPDAVTMHPAGLGLHHPEADHLFQCAKKGCPMETGKDCNQDMIQSAVDRGPHKSAMTPEAMAYIQLEAYDK